MVTCSSKRTIEALELFPSKPRINVGKRICVSLCSGMLGLELGLWKAGFAIKLAMDVDESAKKTIALNFPELDYVVKDIADVSASFILNKTKTKKGQIDLLAGGLPCQAFSKSGLRKGLNDEKSQVFKHYVRLLRGLEPKAFIVENVRGLLSTRKGQDFKKILKDFSKTGYKVYWKVLDAAHYGVPQFRQRLFIVGFRKPLRFSFPQGTYVEPYEVEDGLQSYVTVEEILRDLREVGDHPPYRGKYAHLLKEIPEGLNYSFYTKERGHPNPLFEWRSKFWTFLLKIDRRRPSLTIQACPGNNTGPFHWKNRKLGICELKRLQNVPDWFKMQGSHRTMHRHIGNAVPNLLAYKVGKQISMALCEEARTGDVEQPKPLNVLS